MPEANIKDLVMQAESSSHEADSHIEVSAEIGFCDREPYIIILRDGTYEQHIHVEIDGDGKVVLVSRPNGSFQRDEKGAFCGEGVVRTVLFDSRTAEEPPIEVSRSIALPAIYELDGDGEATGTVHWFCTESCRNTHTANPENIPGQTAAGLDTGWPDQTRCEECGRDLLDEAALRKSHDALVDLLAVTATDAREFTFNFEDEEPATVPVITQFCVNNQFAPEEIKAIIDLKVGEEIRYGGGAAPISMLRRTL